MTHTARGTPASQGFSSSPYVLSLSIFVLLMFIQDGTREAEKLNLEDSTVCVEDHRKIVENQLHDAALVNYEEHMRDHHDGSSLCPTRLGQRTSPTILKEEFAKRLGRAGCTLAKFWRGTRFAE